MPLPPLFRSHLILIFGLGLLLDLSGCSAGVANLASKTNPPSQSSDVVIAISAQSVRVGGQVSFTATESGLAATDGTWSVLGGTGNGAISTTGVYTAPLVLPVPSTVQVVYVTTKTSSASVRVLNLVPVATIATPALITALASSLTITGSGFVHTTLVMSSVGSVSTTVLDANHMQVLLTLQMDPATPVVLALSNSDDDAQSATLLTIPVSLAVIGTTPSVLPRGDTSFAVTGVNLSPSAQVFVDGQAMTTVAASVNSIAVKGFIPPWKGATVTVSLTGGGGADASVLVPLVVTPITYDAASRLVMQTGFFQREDVIEHAQTIGVSAYLAEQFATAGTPYTPQEPGNWNPVSWWVVKQSTAPDQLRMRMAWTLDHLFPTSQFINDGKGPGFASWQTMMEQNAFGNFRDVLKNVVQHTCTGSFLNLADNWAATDAGSEPNQNFGRELMQLYTIGPVLLNADGTQQLDTSGAPIPSYDQSTVVAMTNAFTGWDFGPLTNPDYYAFGVDWSVPLRPVEDKHDHYAKRLFGTTIPAGQTASQDREAALDLLFNHPNLPPYITKQLIQHFVKSDPSPAYVARASAVFVNNGMGVRGDLRAVLSAVFSDEEARAGDVTHIETDGVDREPMLFVPAVMGFLNNPGSDQQVASVSAAMGEAGPGFPSVFGFYRPDYQIPGTHIIAPQTAVITQFYTVRKSQILYGIISSERGGFTSDYLTNSWLVSHFTTPEAFVDLLNHALCQGKMTASTVQTIVDSTSAVSSSDIQGRVKTALFLALNSDDFNVMQ